MTTAAAVQAALARASWRASTVRYVPAQQLPMAALTIEAKSPCRAWTDSAGSPVTTIKICRSALTFGRYTMRA